MRISRSTALSLGYLGLGALDSWLAGSADPRAHRVRMVTKSALMPLLTASLVTDENARNSPLFASTVAGQVAGWGGDVLLLGDSSTELFAAGAGSFGVGHAAYITGFRRHRDRRTRLRDAAIGKVAVRLFAGGGPMMAVGAAKEEKILGPAVLGYTALLSSMLANAGHLDPALPTRARRRTLAGAALFAASDTLLGLRKFWWKSAPARSETVVMSTYVAGQFLISKGAAAAGS